MLAKKQDGAIARNTILHQSKIRDDFFRRGVFCIGWHSFLIDTFLQKVPNCLRIYIINRSTIARHIFPASAEFLHQKLLQCQTAQLLVGRSASHIENSFIRDGNVWRFDTYLNYIFPVTLYMADNRNNTQHRHYLVGDILKLLMKMRHTLDRHIIVNADINTSALRISEATYPLEIFIFPNALIFCVLILVVHFANLAI